MIREILIPLDLSDHTVAATDRGCEIASKLPASVTGLTVVDIKGINDAVALPFHAELRDFPHPHVVEMAKDAAERLEDARIQFRATCRERSIPCKVRRLSGSPAGGILDLARFHDLLVMGLQTQFHFETDDKPGDTLTEVLDTTPIPALLVPTFESNPLRRALIAFDGSSASTRALHAFAEFWPTYRPEVRLITSCHDENLGGHLLGEAEKFLESHDVVNITTHLTQQPLREEVENHYLEWADLIVAGVRSKPALKRLFIGSFTRSLIKHGHRTLLLCR